MTNAAPWTIDETLLFRYNISSKKYYQEDMQYGLGK